MDRGGVGYDATRATAIHRSTTTRIIVTLSSVCPSSLIPVRTTLTGKTL
ncbi:hypothetical protein [Reticulibacter mediterranei]|nr:hypothetical protein [Reticulibacter mediterranei]